MFSWILYGHVGLLLVILFPEHVTGAPEGFVYCKLTGDVLTVKMGVQTNDAIINDIFVSDEFSVPKAGCPVTGTGAADDLYVATGSYNLLTQQPEGPDCGIFFDLNDGLFKSRMRTCKQEGRNRDGDVMFIFQCRSDGIIQSATSTDIAAYLEDIYVNYGIPIQNLELLAIFPATLDLVETIAVGEDFDLKLEFKIAVTTQAYAMKGAYCKSMVVSPDFSFLSEDQLYILDPVTGCPRTEHQFMAESTNLVLNQDLSFPLDGPPFELHTSVMGPIKAFFFDQKPDSRTIWIGCDAGFCYLDSDPRCQDYCSVRLNEINGRRRRSANSSAPNMIYSKITVVDKPAGSSSLTPTLVGVMVGCALAVAVVAVLALMICLLMRRGRRKKERSRQYKRHMDYSVSTTSTKVTIPRSIPSSTYLNKFSNPPRKH